jgi:hypothetical protein
MYIANLENMGERSSNYLPGNTFDCMKIIFFNTDAMER